MLRLATGQRKILINGGSDAQYVPTGHIVFVRGATILAVPFDLARLEVTGPPTPILEGVYARRFSIGWPSAAFATASQHG